METDLIVLIDCTHNGKEYSFAYNYGPNYDESDAEHMFEEGNYSCDCNLSRFLSDSGYDFDTLDCGDTIEITKIRYLWVPAEHKTEAVN